MNEFYHRIGQRDQTQVRVFDFIQAHWTFFTSSKDGTWSWKFRCLIWFSCIVIGTVIGFLWYLYGFDFVMEIFRSKDESSVNSNGFFQSSTSFLFTGLVVGISKFLIGTHDTKKESQDRFNQIEQGRVQQNEVLFSNAVKLLHSDSSKSAQAFGLVGLSRLKKHKIIDSNRIDGATMGVVLDHVLFRGSYFRDCNFNYTQLLGVSFTSSAFWGTDFSHVNFQYVLFKGRINFVGADFSSVDFCGADFSKSKFIDSDFGGGGVDDFDFEDMNLQNATINIANFDVVRFYGGSFYDSRLTGTKQDDGSYYHARMSNVSFWSCGFREASFKNMYFGNSYFSHPKMKNAKYNQNTKFPEGFDPKRHGMVYVET